jgi:hypothetical protein
MDEFVAISLESLSLVITHTSEHYSNIIGVWLILGLPFSYLFLLLLGGPDNFQIVLGLSSRSEHTGTRKDAVR